MTTNPKHDVHNHKVAAAVKEEKLGWSWETVSSFMPGIPSDPSHRTPRLSEDDMANLRVAGFWGIDGAQQRVRRTFYLDDAGTFTEGSTDFEYGSAGSVHASTVYAGYQAFELTGSIGPSATGSPIPCKLTVSVRMSACPTSANPTPEQCSACNSGGEGFISADVKVNLHKDQQPECETSWFPLASQAVQAKATMYRMGAALSRIALCGDAVNTPSTEVAGLLEQDTAFETFMESALATLPDVGIGPHFASSDTAQSAIQQGYPTAHYYRYAVIASTALARSLFPPPFDTLTAGGDALDFTYFPNADTSPYASQKGYGLTITGDLSGGTTCEMGVFVANLICFSPTKDGGIHSWPGQFCTSGFATFEAADVQSVGSLEGMKNSNRRNAMAEICDNEYLQTGNRCPQGRQFASVKTALLTSPPTRECQDWFLRADSITRIKFSYSKLALGIGKSIGCFPYAVARKADAAWDGKFDPCGYREGHRRRREQGWGIGGKGCAATNSDPGTEPVPSPSC